MSHPKFQFHFLYLVLIPLISVAVYWQLKNIVLRPGCSAVGEKHSLNKFSVQRAYENLVILSHEEKGFGEHSFGSRQCHLVHQWLVRWIRDAIAARSLQLEQQQGYFKVEVAEQNESNEFVFYSSHLMGNRMRRYQNVTNIMVKIYPAVSQQRSYSGEAILVNSHFDSGVSSPGAFDDGVPVVAMMEMFQRMLDQLLAHHANTSVPLLRHPIVFLWNGAEEMGLLGAHAFMQSHPWAKDIRAFINLEAAGFGGGATVFQTTNTWIAQKYAKVIVHPLGNSLGQDLFQSGIVPSDTDYRFFTGMKKQEVIHGVDSAFSENGHWYHTEFDSLTKNHYSQDDIKKSIQHMGENAASLMGHLAFMDASFPNATIDAHSDQHTLTFLG